MYTIKLENKYTYIYFPDLCSRIKSSLREIQRHSLIEFNLVDVTFIDPFGMISIIGACRYLYNHFSICSRVVLPSGEAGKYMYYAGFNLIESQEPFIEIKKPTNILDWFKSNRSSGGHLTFFDSERDIRMITEEVEKWMDEHEYDEAEQSNMSTFISEMVQNVCQHSRTPQRGVLCRQAYKRKDGTHFLAWAIGDAGVGIRQSLLDADVPGIVTMTDSDAIQEVLKGRSSIQDDITRGNGFPNLLKGVQARRATLFIHSNRGIYGWNTDNSSMRKTVWNESPISGTTVSFIIG
jgi:anti-sigma regulatory factor (Ser/Thr protein kinase)